MLAMVWLVLGSEQANGNQLDVRAPTPEPGALVLYVGEDGTILHEDEKIPEAQALQLIAGREHPSDTVWIAVQPDAHTETLLGLMDFIKAQGLMIGIKSVGQGDPQDAR